VWFFGKNFEVESIWNVHCFTHDTLYLHADVSNGAAPRYPLPQTQAGVLDHLQIFLSDMSAAEHAECSEIINTLRGSRRIALSAYITHIIVDENICQNQEKRSILEFLEQSDNGCKVVQPSWLRACAKVSPI
jgi:hypothetical protein